MSRMYGDYDAACRAHATAQGLDAPNAILRQHGFQTEVLQTGGFCMVLQAFHDPSPDVNVQVWVTVDESTDPDVIGDTYLVCAYDCPPEDEGEGIYDGETSYACTYDVRLADLPTLVGEFSRKEFTP